MRRVLLVEDNPDLAFGLRTSLEVEGYDVLHAETGAQGLETALAEAPDLIVLDLMLPEMSGYEVLRRLRREGREMPVLILTARGEEADKVQGFRLGADDYVVKPVGVLEFLARVEALLRRAQPRAAAATVARFGDLEVDGDRRMVAIGGVEIELSPLEFDLLNALALRRGSLVSRAELLKEVWGYRSLVESRTVDTHIAKLRAKIDGGERSRIVTVRKKGYRLRMAG
ncbi:MAG TPA: response regulator transcription factor [Gemmatimonadales bacterium]|nr:response regulator transcription factor [Gemmatimonadales bacterium]